MRPRAVDEVEEDELPHLAPREHAAGEPALLGPFLAGLERLGLGAHGRDLVAVGKALRRVIRASLEATSTDSPGRAARPAGVSLLAHDLEAVRLVERRGSSSAFVSNAHGSPARVRGLEPGREQGAADALRAARAGSTPIPARYQCGPGTREPPEVVDRATVGEERAGRRTQPERRRDAARSAAPERIRGRPGGSQRAAAEHGTGGRPDSAPTVEAARKSQRPSGRRARAAPRRQGRPKRSPEHRARPAIAPSRRTISSALEASPKHPRRARAGAARDDLSARRPRPTIRRGRERP